MKTLTSILTSVILVASTAQAAPINIPQSLKQFGVFAGGDLEYACARFDSGAAAVGKGSFTRMGIAENAEEKALTLLFGGDFLMRNGAFSGQLQSEANVFLTNYSAGNVTAKGTAYCSSQGVYKTCSSGIAPTMDVRTLARALEDLDSSLEALNATTVTLSGQNSLVVSLKPGDQAVAIEEADWKKAKSLDIAGPADSSLVVKVRGRNPEWIARTITLTSGVTPKNILFYFEEARAVNIERMVIPGTIVAPRADVSLLGGEILGGLYVGGNVNGNPAGFNFESTVTCDPNTGGAIVYGETVRIQAEAGREKRFAWKTNPFMIELTWGYPVKYCLINQIELNKPANVKFTVAGLPQWASLDDQGCIVGFPEQSHIGYSQLAVTATDGKSVLPNEGYLFVFDSNK